MGGGCGMRMVKCPGGGGNRPDRHQGAFSSKHCVLLRQTPPTATDNPSMWEPIARQMKFAATTKGKYPDVSCKNAPVPRRYPILNCCCGKPCGIATSKHPSTAGRAYYCCLDCREYCNSFFFQWIDGPEVYDDYLLSPYVGIFLGPWPADTWTRLVRPPPSPPAIWKLDQTTPKFPPLVWCKHCQDLTRWCPLYGPNTLDESWKVFDEEMRQEGLKVYEEEKKRKEEIRMKWLEIEKANKEHEKQKKIEAKRKKEEEAMEMKLKRRQDINDSKEWIKKAFEKFKPTWK